MFVEYHFVHDMVTDGSITIEKIVPAENRVDMMTKPISIFKFKHCLELASVRSA